ncbi:hypothetical protein TNCV_1228271 [Trichonephila clavipes]|nr:hypothetical protein TNCV_1228271 [Trichonephila clavipes]
MSRDMCEVDVRTQLETGFVTKDYASLRLEGLPIDVVRKLEEEGASLDVILIHGSKVRDSSQLALEPLYSKGCFFERTATAGSDVVQSRRPIFDDFLQNLWPYIGNNTVNVVFQMVKRLWLIRKDQ